VNNKLISGRMTLASNHSASGKGLLDLADRQNLAFHCPSVMLLDTFDFARFLHIVFAAVPTTDPDIVLYYTSNRP